MTYSYKWTLIKLWRSTNASFNNCNNSNFLLITSLVVTMSIVMLVFKDLDTSTKICALIHPIITLIMLLVIDMTILVHIPISIHKREKISIMSIPYKAKSMATMINVTIWRKKMIVIYLHSK